MSSNHQVSPEIAARRLIDEGFSEGRLEVADELIADDLVEHQDFGPDHAPGAEGVKAVIASLHRAFSDFRLTIEDLVRRRWPVWTRNVATGTTTARSRAPPTGGDPDPRLRLLRVVDGQIVEHWGGPTASPCCSLRSVSLQPPVPRAAIA